MDSTGEETSGPVTTDANAAETVPEYQDQLPTTKEWVRQVFFKDFRSRAIAYLKSLFPIFQWIGNYNLVWLTGDLIAGVTVGSILVPQSMSYAQLANLPTQYGLYSSFIGVFTYCFFATSKDVTIGPVAVMSLLVADTISNVQNRNPEYSNPTIATAFALLVGAIVMLIGLLRLGFIIEFIPMPAVAGFMTGSAITIASSQVPNLLGLSSYLNSRDAAYMVIINTLRNLPHCSVDAAFGLVSLFVLYFWRFLGNYTAKRWPRYERVAFFALVLRAGIVIIVGTAISYGVVHGHENNPPIKVVGTVPRGFQDVGLPTIDANLASSIAPELPVGCIVLLLEHIAIGKSFGRINDYKVNPNQELIAIGVTNVVGTFFNAYPATGSFSRTAIKAKSGVRTPIAGIFTGIVVIIALYALTEAFYYIPNSVLAAVIVHAVGDLIAHPRQVYTFWKIQPLEAIIFLIGVIITVFSSVENGIYTTIALSGALLLFRIAKPRGRFLGIVRVAQQTAKGMETRPSQIIQRDVFVPLDQGKGLHNPSITVSPPPPGILIYRLEESFLYPNAANFNTMITDEARRQTRRGKMNIYRRLGDRPWNYRGPRKLSEKAQEEMAKDARPRLRAVILDFSSVSHLDTTGVQSLVDTRKELSVYADQAVEFHFANILTPWVKRALIAAGFGLDTDASKRPVEVAGVVPFPSGPTAEKRTERNLLQRPGPSSGHFDIEESIGPLLSAHGQESPGEKSGGSDDPNEQLSESSRSSDFIPLIGSNTPYFHVDLSDALRAALNAHGSI